METYKEEALRAKEIAEKRFVEKDFVGAKNYALKAKSLYPELEGLSQMVATFDVYVASEVKVNSSVDYYSVLGLNPSADKDTVKKQYRKMAVLLHPDKNKSVGADGAFKLVSEAWTFLSDSPKRSSCDHKRNKQRPSATVQTDMSSVHMAGVAGYSNCSNLSTAHARLDTFWTVCTSCKIQYEYLRKYVNKRLSCKNCRGTFIAVETGTAPVNGSFPWSYAPGNGYGSHGYDGVAYVPTSTPFYTANGVSGYHSGHGYEYASNVSYQWGTSAGTIGHNGSSSVSADVFYQTNGSVNVTGAKVKQRANGKRSAKNAPVSVESNTFTIFNESSGSKASQPDKRRKVVATTGLTNGYEKQEPKSAPEATLPNRNAIGHDLPKSSELTARRNAVAPAFDARKLLIDKARTEILKKLKEMNLAPPTIAVPQKNVKLDVIKECQELPARSDSVAFLQQPVLDRKPIAITVPDSDFHDFDKDRSEESFKPKQIWAVYDDEDGMPRLYCLIREIISVEPFKIHITYLGSKTDTEFGLVNWIDSGFTKSCGHFRAKNSDIVEQVNIFSHVLSREKAGRGGCVKIYPKRGDIWAVYRNWSPEWDRSTPDEVRHQYEMVEVLDDYSEDLLGVCVAPLVKLAGFKTVYQRNANKDESRWIPRREMLRFSHRVPSWLLKEAAGLPEGCWDLDPAATPDELLHAEKKEEEEGEGEEREVKA